MRFSSYGRSRSTASTTRGPTASCRSSSGTAPAGRSSRSGATRCGTSVRPKIEEAAVQDGKQLGDPRRDCSKESEAIAGRRRSVARVGGSGPPERVVVHVALAEQGHLGGRWR